MVARLVVTETERDEAWDTATWRAARDGVTIGSVTAWVRPDGRCFVSFSHCEPEARQPLLDAVAGVGHCELITTAPDDPATLSLYRSFGFEPARRETEYLISTDVAAARLAGVALPQGVSVISPSDADLARLRLLDDELRDDVPGTAGWKWKAAAFEEETFGPQYDPALYAVAVRDGEYVGLARVWKRPEKARLGMIGVLRSERRQGLARALMAHVVAALADRRVEAMTAEVDDANAASIALITGLGGRSVGASLELVKVLR